MANIVETDFQYTFLYKYKILYGLLLCNLRLHRMIQGMDLYIYF